MSVRIHKSFAVQAAFCAFGALCLLLGISGRGLAASTLSAQVSTHFAIADFDGDSRPDLASIHVGQSSSRNTRYWIAFHLSGGGGQTVGITAPTGGLQITSRDVNGDNFPDVIITTAWTNKPVAILLNDGFGNFTTSSPAEFQSAFAAPETSWTPAANEIRDAAAALLFARCVAGDSGTESGSCLPSGASRLFAVRSSSASLLASVLPFIGRAPPFRSHS
jgi:FG-GAP-like repeat